MAENIAITIYHEGDSAFAYGEPRTANPYPTPSDDSACPWAWWDLGWRQASEDPQGPLAKNPKPAVH